MQSLKFLYITIFILLGISYIYAQENTTQTPWAISYIENKLSAPNREVKLEGVSGILDSHVSIKKITISDSTGPWLIAQNLTLIWNRSSLFSDTLQIDKLNIASISILRKPNKTHNILSELVSLSKINLNNLPVNININKLNINKVHFSKMLAGTSENFNIIGFFKFDNYNLNTILQINGIDEASNGYLNINYLNNINKLKVDFHINENKGGVIAHLLNVQNKNSIKLSVKGGGTPNNLSLILKSTIDNAEALHGFFTINKAELLNAELSNSNTSRNINFNLAGPVHDFVPDTYKPFFDKYSSISANAIILPNNNIHINNFTIEGSALKAHGSALILADGFLRNLFFNADLRNYNDKQQSTLGTINISYGDNNNTEWHAKIRLHNNKKNIVSDINMFGNAENLDDSNSRHVSLNLTGTISQNYKIINISSIADFRANSPILIKTLKIQSQKNSINMSGIINNKIFNGFTSLNINDLKELGTLFNKNWNGQINLAGKTLISKHQFSQAINGSVNNLFINLPYKGDIFLKNFTDINGDISYVIDGKKKINLTNLKVNNKDLHFIANGFASYNDADFIANISKINIHLLNEHLDGTAQGRVVSKGHNGIIISGANLTSSKLFINKEPFLNNNIKFGIITKGLDKFKPQYKGFLNFNSENKQQKINLGLIADGRHNCRFASRHVPLSILQPFINFKLPLLKLNINGIIINNIVNFNIISNDNNLILNSEGSYNIKKNILKGALKGKINSILLNEWLRTKQIEVLGFVDFNLASNGSLNPPDLTGTVSTNNAKFFDIKHNIKLTNINITGILKNHIINFSKATANVGALGKITALGNIDFNNFKAPIANLNINLNKILYRQGAGFNTTYSGILKLTGSLTEHPKLQGNIILFNSIILISRNINAANPLEVQHMNSNNSILSTLQRADMELTKNTTANSAYMIYDVNIIAPNHLFVKGMGVNIEMKGKMHIFGKNGALRSLGSFKMVAGHLNLLSHHFNFDKGDISINGDIRPFLSFSASTAAANNLTAKVKLEGYIDDIKLEFSSTPPLPQDEILAQLLFRRSVKQLSAFQLAQIITTLSNLSGSNNFFNSLQSATTLDNINIDSGENGEIGVSAGRYMTKNIYTSFGATQKGTTKASINWDLPHNFKVTGQYQSNNQNNLGLYYSNDY